MSPTLRTGVLSEKECARLLQTQSVGRIALVVDGRPEIFPVNYAFDAGVVVFRTATGLKLERGPYTPTAFEVDQYDVEARVAWSVVVHGTAQDISQSLDSLSARLRSLTVTPAAPGPRPHWMAVYADKITGRRFSIR